MAKDDYKNLLSELTDEINREFNGETEQTSNNSTAIEAAELIDAVDILTDENKSLNARKAELYRKIHSGHRQRVKKSAEIDDELDSFAEHEVLEYLLFFGIPRGDTNPIAHDLLNRFYSLHAVVNTSKEILMQVPQMTENAVSLLHSIIPIARRIEQSRVRETRYITTTADAVEILRPLFFNRNREMLYLVCIDQNDRLVGVERISEGDVNFTPFDIKKFTLAIAKHGASKVIMAHNHPAGTVMPSESDVDATRRIQIALSAMSVLLVDHIIIAGENYYSFYRDNQMTQFYDTSDKLFSMGICSEYRDRKAKRNFKPTDYILEKETYAFMNRISKKNDDKT